MWRTVREGWWGLGWVGLAKGRREEKENSGSVFFSQERGGKESPCFCAVFFFSFSRVWGVVSLKILCWIDTTTPN